MEQSTFHEQIKLARMVFLYENKCFETVKSGILYSISSDWFKFKFDIINFCFYIFSLKVSSWRTGSERLSVL